MTAFCGSVTVPTMVLVMTTWASNPVATTTTKNTNSNPLQFRSIPSSWHNGVPTSPRESRFGSYRVSSRYFETFQFSNNVAIYSPIPQALSRRIKWRQTLHGPWKMTTPQKWEGTEGFCGPLADPNRLSIPLFSPRGKGGGGCGGRSSRVPDLQLSLQYQFLRTLLQSINPFQ